MAEGVVELDERRRTYLGRFGRPEHTRYLVHDAPDGTITLEPAVVLTEHDLALMSRPDVLAVVDEARAHPERLIRGRARARQRPGPQI